MGYYDEPDGQQCFHKMLVASKNAGFIGLAVSTYDVLMYSKTQGYAPTLARYIKHTIPLAAAGATFAAVACATTTLRGKDDYWNSYMGGWAAGGIIGVAARSFAVGIPVGFFLGAAAVVFKDSKEEGYDLFPTTDRHVMGPIDYRKYDFTMTSDKK